MKIASLHIENFRGISKVSVDGLGDTVIIAGQNGSGKSCVFDAIRLLKSSYGGYQQNEWHQFFGEFSIQINGESKAFIRLFNNPEKPIVIRCKFRLGAGEKKYISANAKKLLEEIVWQDVLPDELQSGGYQGKLFSRRFRDREPEVQDRVSKELPDMEKELSQQFVEGGLTIFPSGDVKSEPSTLLSVVFANYKPGEIGVIEFHGAQRHYSRESISGISLRFEDVSQSHGHHALYNYGNKYNNVKSEMAGDFLKEILSRKASPEICDDTVSLTETLKELFESFFPEKKFLGPVATADGRLDFPVKTSNGSLHDLDELSSGEKEILYGYLRMRRSAPKDSIILLDEPELHLNPRLIRGLAEFYRKHLVDALQNQLWLVTHSDALIREAVGKPGFNVFHMISCGSDQAGDSQLTALTIGKDLEVATADLVGDLAAYRPGGKGLIFEGGGDSDFDKTIALSLFSEELQGINLISGSNKSRVKALHEILKRAYDKGELSTKFYAVVDKDTDDLPVDESGLNVYCWDVYHVENYLLCPQIIALVVNGLEFNSRCTAETVLMNLELAARKVVPKVIGIKMTSHVNALIGSAINLRCGHADKSLALGLYNATKSSFSRFEKVVQELTENELVIKENEGKSIIDKSFSDGNWLKVIPGREILKQYMQVEKLTINYEYFRNLIISKMVEKGYKPEGMRQVICKVVSD